MVSTSIPDQHIEQLRREWLAQAKESAVVRTPIVEDDGDGGKRDTGEVSTYGPVAASRAPYTSATAADRVLAERENTQAMYVIFLPHDAEVTHRSTIVMNGVEVFRVQAVMPKRTYQVKRRALARYAGLVGES